MYECTRERRASQLTKQSKVASESVHGGDAQRPSGEKQEGKVNSLPSVDDYVWLIFASNEWMNEATSSSSSLLSEAMTILIKIDILSVMKRHNWCVVRRSARRNSPKRFRLKRNCVTLINHSASDWRYVVCQFDSHSASRYITQWTRHPTHTAISFSMVDWGSQWELHWFFHL